MLIAILDDDEQRQEYMQEALSEVLQPPSIQFFDNAPGMIEWLGTNIHTVDLFSLDHDLGPNWRHADKVFDPGTGRDVANYLAKHEPVCPIVVHTSNGMCAPGMILELEGSGWTVERVVPYNVYDWITQSWKKKIQEYVRDIRS